MEKNEQVGKFIPVKKFIEDNLPDSSLIRAEILREVLKYIVDNIEGSGGGGSTEAITELIKQIFGGVEIPEVIDEIGSESILEHLKTGLQPRYIELQQGLSIDNYITGENTTENLTLEIGNKEIVFIRQLYKTNQNENVYDGQKTYVVIKGAGKYGKPVNSETKPLLIEDFGLISDNLLVQVSNNIVKSVEGVTADTRGDISLLKKVLLWDKKGEEEPDDETKYTKLASIDPQTGETKFIDRSAVGKVKTVNGKTGDVVLKTSDLENDSDYTTNATLTAHTSNKSNPHNVTKSQIGLGNVDNTSDLSKPISTATQTELNKKLDKPTTNNTPDYVLLADGSTAPKSDFGKVDTIDGIEADANKNVELHALRKVGKNIITDETFNIDYSNQEYRAVLGSGQTFLLVNKNNSNQWAAFGRYRIGFDDKDKNLPNKCRYIYLDPNQMTVKWGFKPTPVEGNPSAFLENNFFILPDRVDGGRSVYAKFRAIDGYVAYLQDIQDIFSKPTHWTNASQRFSGLVDKSADATFNQFVLLDNNGNLAKSSNAYNVLLNSLALMTPTQKVDIMKLFNGQYSSGQIKTDIILMPVIEIGDNLNGLSKLDIYGANLLIDPDTSYVRIKEFGNIDNWADCVWSNVDSTRLEVFVENSFLEVGKTYVFEIKHSVQLHTTVVSIDVVQQLNNVDLSTLTYTITKDDVNNADNYLDITVDSNGLVSHSVKSAAPDNLRGVLKKVRTNPIAQYSENLVIIIDFNWGYSTGGFEFPRNFDHIGLSKVIQYTENDVSNNIVAGVGTGYSSFNSGDKRTAIIGGGYIGKSGIGQCIIVKKGGTLTIILMMNGAIIRYSSNATITENYAIEFNFVGRYLNAKQVGTYNISSIQKF